jgi:hypothetical protein
MNPLKKIWIGKSKAQRSLLFVLFLCFTCATSIIVYTTLEEPEPSVSDKSIPVSKEKIVQQTIQPVEIVPDEKTEFFSKEEGTALLYYSIVNDSVRFFKTNGIDPVTGENLRPVTQEIIDQYQDTTEDENEDSSEEIRSFTVSEVTIIKKEKKVIKPKKKKKPKRESIWNTKLVNSAFEDEISLFIFDENNQLDALLTKRFKKEFSSKDYFVTDAIIYPDAMNSEIATHLQNANVNYFEGDLSIYTDYVCVGLVSYGYGQNRFRNDLTDCTLQINYFIYNAQTGERMFAEEDKIVGSGQTKKQAKESAVQKFVL